MQNINKFYRLTMYLTLAIFPFIFNFYYSSFGVEPMDTFVLFNGGYKVLNGLTPFKDYWLVTGPLMDYLNAFFFKIFDADITIWLDTIEEGRFEDTNALFEPPEKVDFHITEWNDHNHIDVAKRIKENV